MDVLFYDRKNDCNVKASQLMEINLVECYGAIDDEGFGAGTPVKTLTEKYGEECHVIGQRVVSKLGYKSEKCPAFCNWDNHLNPSDLVFLKLV